MQEQFDIILPVFLLIASSYVSVWQRWISDTGVDGLMRLCNLSPFAVRFFAPFPL